jgi:hypothetical protein
MDAIDTTGQWFREGCFLIAHIIRNAVQTRSRRNSVFTKAATHTHMGRLLTVVEQALATVVAMATGHAPAWHHSIAWPKALYCCSHIYNFACPFMAWNLRMRQLPHAFAAAHVRTHITRTDPAGMDAQQDFIRRRYARHWDILNAQIAHAIQLGSPHHFIHI